MIDRKFKLIKTFGLTPFKWLFSFLWKSKTHFLADQDKQEDEGFSIFVVKLRFPLSLQVFQVNLFYFPFVSLW